MFCTAGSCLVSAARGFLGGSLYTKLGPLFRHPGLGQDEPKDYYNLSLTPTTPSLSARARASRRATRLPDPVRDDRLDTGQRVMHAGRAGNRAKDAVDGGRVLQGGPPDSDPASERIHVAGGLDYDFDRYCASGKDLHVNFSDNNMVRVAAGIRF